MLQQKNVVGISTYFGYFDLALRKFQGRIYFSNFAFFDWIILQRLENQVPPLKVDKTNSKIIQNPRFLFPIVVKAEKNLKKNLDKIFLEISTNTTAQRYYY